MQRTMLIICMIAMAMLIAVILYWLPPVDFIGP